MSLTASNNSTIVGWNFVKPESTLTENDPIFTPNISDNWDKKTAVKIQIWARCLSQATPKNAKDAHEWICVTKDGLGKDFYFACTEERYQQRVKKGDKVKKLTFNEIFVRSQKIMLKEVKLRNLIGNSFGKDKDVVVKNITTLYDRLASAIQYSSNTNILYDKINDHVSNLKVISDSLNVMSARAYNKHTTYQVSVWGYFKWYVFGAIRSHIWHKFYDLRPKIAETIPNIQEIQRNFINNIRENARRSMKAAHDALFISNDFENIFHNQLNTWSSDKVYFESLMVCTEMFIEKISYGMREPTKQIVGQKFDEFNNTTLIMARYLKCNP